jgi:hypothetical protein
MAGRPAGAAMRRIFSAALPRRYVPCFAHSHAWVPNVLEWILPGLSERLSTVLLVLRLIEPPLATVATPSI